MRNFDESIEYILKFLLGDDSESVYYGNDYKNEKKLIIWKSEFWDDGVYGTASSIPITPLKKLPYSEDIPFLFGDDRIEKKDGQMIIYADVIASSFYMMSRYEEMLFPQKRDALGCYLAKYSIMFENGYGLRPIVDEYSKYLKSLLFELDGIDRKSECGFSKIWLTHDLDAPFYFHRFDNLIRQWVKNIFVPSCRVHNCLKKYISGENDPYDTFDRIFELDNKVKAASSNAEAIYFIITAKNHFWNTYRNIKSKKYKKLIRRILNNGDGFGVHLSLEAGKNSHRIKSEVARMPINNTPIRSRYHYLRWIDIQAVSYILDSGINEDYTLGYADHAGFRVGTCHSYYFMDPTEGSLTKLKIIPMQIMEVNYSKDFMDLSYQDALKISKEIVDQVYAHGGELNVLWHNNQMTNDYYEDLYSEVLDYVVNKLLSEKIVTGH